MNLTEILIVIITPLMMWIGTLLPKPKRKREKENTDRLLFLKKELSELKLENQYNDKIEDEIKDKSFWNYINLKLIKMQKLFLYDQFVEQTRTRSIC